MAVLLSVARWFVFTRAGQIVALILAAGLIVWLWVGSEVRDAVERDRAERIEDALDRSERMRDAAAGVDRSRDGVVDRLRDGRF